MKFLHVLIVFLLGTILFVSESAAQYPTQTPTRQEQARREAEDLNRRSREMRERFERLRRDQPNPAPRRGNQSPGKPAASNAFIFKPSKEDRQLVAPEVTDSLINEEFLRQPNTGLVRLLSDQGCREDRRIAIANNFCIKYRNLYGASVYSFRIQNYMPVRFGDIIYKNGTLKTIGKLTLGFLTDLGKDIDLKSVSAETAGARYVFDFAPPETMSRIESALRDFQNGVEAGGFRYQKSLLLEEDHTYLLRSVAYQNGKQKKDDELLMDERKDVIIALRVVRLSADEEGGATLLWRELQRRDTVEIAMSGK